MAVTAEKTQASENKEQTEKVYVGCKEAMTALVAYAKDLMIWRNLGMPYKVNSDGGRDKYLYCIEDCQAWFRGEVL